LAQRCEDCDQNARQVRINVTDLQGTLLDHREVCVVCAKQLGFETGTV
jgi:hypothetical protein